MQRILIEPDSQVSLRFLGVQARRSHSHQPRASLKSCEPTGRNTGLIIYTIGGAGWMWGGKIAPKIGPTRDTLPVLASFSFETEAYRKQVQATGPGWSHPPEKTCPHSPTRTHPCTQQLSSAATQKQYCSSTAKCKLHIYNTTH